MKLQQEKKSLEDEGRRAQYKADSQLQDDKNKLKELSEKLMGDKKKLEE
jgi:hypothetical protein